MPTPVETVIAFFARWDDGKAAMRQSFHDYLAADAVWENVGLKTTTGPAEALQWMDETGGGLDYAVCHVDILAIAAARNMVLTERIDRLMDADGKELHAFPVMGALEVVDGRIMAWREYFDVSALKA